jgi:nucleoside phosphorylase
VRMPWDSESLGPVSLDTTPDYPPQRATHVENAINDLPSVLQEMPSGSGHGATEPGLGHRIVIAERLEDDLSTRGHSRAAAAWAIHHLVQSALLRAEIAVRIERPIIGHRPDPNSSVVGARGLFGSIADDPRYQIPIYGEPVRVPLSPPDKPVPHKWLLVRSTDALWNRLKAVSLVSNRAPTPLASEQLAQADAEPAGSIERPALDSNPFRQLCALALEIREEELQRDLKPAHEREQRKLEERATLENRVRDLVADCCIAGRNLGDGREREAEEAARQLANGCLELLVWEAVVRLGRLTDQEAAQEKGGPCVVLCNRLDPGYEQVDHLARLYDRVETVRNPPSALIPVQPSTLERLPDYRPEDQPWFTPLPEEKSIARESLEQHERDVPIVLLTAVAVERDAVKRRLFPFNNRDSILRVHIGPQTYFLGMFGAYPVALTMCEKGATGRDASILTTNDAISVWNPKAVIMPGIAFGKGEKQKIADILLATYVIPYEGQRVGELRIFRDPQPVAGLLLSDRFKHAAWQFTRPDNYRCAMHRGPLLSGEKLVDDPDFKAELFGQFPQAIGGEMEGYGVAAAAGRAKVEWIVAKAICDWGDGKKDKKHQALAAAAAVSLVHAVLSDQFALRDLLG